MALMSIVLAPYVGKLTDRVHPRILTGFGFSAIVVSLVWLSPVMTPDSATWQILLPMALLGIGNAVHLGARSARPPPATCRCSSAGAGAGVYNATRQVGAVLGSAAIAVLMDSRLAAQGLSFQPTEASGGGAMPAAALDAFSKAMADSMLLPPVALLLGLVGVLFFQHSQRGPVPVAAPAAGAEAVTP